ncbi:MAG: DUF5915 domain-containing protein, partial [Anaerococcus vaginalis]
VTDRIDIFFSADDELENALKDFEEEIKKETLADTMEVKDLDIEEFELNDKTVKIELERK